MRTAPTRAERSGVLPPPPRTQAGSTVAAEPGHKLVVLESIRGIAAFAVFNYHFIALFADQVWTAPYGVMAASTLGVTFALAQATPLNVFVNSELAVRTFFVLSGFVLSWRFCNDGRDDILRAAAVKRGVRLAIPIWASLIVAFVVLRVFSSHEVLLQMDPIFDKTYLRQDVDYAPTWWELFKQCVKVMFFGVDGRTFNRSLWTMQHELLGSYVVYCFLILFGTVKHRWIFYLGVAGVGLLLSRPYVVDFLIGMGICDFTIRGQISSRALKLVRSLALPGAAVAVGYMILWNPLLDRGWRDYELIHVTPALASGLIVIGALYSPAMQSLLQFKPFVFLGKISFGSYLLHLSVIYGIGGWIFKWGFDYSGNYAASFLASYTVSLLGLLLVATIFTRYVDDSTISLTRWLAKTFTSERA